jgi:hypothetical protein
MDSICCFSTSFPYQSRYGPPATDLIEHMPIRGLHSPQEWIDFTLSNVLKVPQFVSFSYTPMIPMSFEEEFFP